MIGIRTNKTAFCALLVALTFNMAASMFRHAESGSKLVEGSGQFAWNMFMKQASSQAGDNIFYSPMSISLALAMTYAGAGGATKEQMRSSLGYSDLHDDQVHQCFEDLHLHMHNTGNNYTLRTANKVYVEKTYDVLSSFLEKTKSHYKSEVTNVDFVSKFNEARQEINKWVEDQTAEKIKDLLVDGALDSLTRLVLVNAIYFKGNWAHKFDSEDTSDSFFHTSTNDKIPVRMMYQEKKFNCGYNEKIGAKILELPYVGDKLSLIIVLPSQNDGLDAVLGKLNIQSIINCEKTFSMMPIKTQVHIPRFKLEQSIDLGDTLAALGMSDLFDMQRADLSGIDGTRDLYVSKVVHKAFIEVNEEGSEAAAATAVVIALRSLPRIMQFRADHPFMFYIRDNASKSILFLGRVSKPAAATDRDEL